MADNNFPRNTNRVSPARPHHRVLQPPPLQNVEDEMLDFFNEFLPEGETTDVPGTAAGTAEDEMAAFYNEFLPVPPGHHRMPDGSIMRDSEMPSSAGTGATDASNYSNVRPSSGGTE